MNFQLVRRGEIRRCLITVALVPMPVLAIGLTVSFLPLCRVVS